MTKTIYLVRHAKAGLGEFDLSDFERSLTESGIRDASFMGKLLKEKYNNLPEIIISSSAKRAKTTANLFAKELDYPSEKIILDDEIYSNGANRILELISSLKEVNSAIFFGHNPDISMLVSRLVGSRIGGMPTCSIAHIEFKMKSWDKIYSTSGNLISLNSPKHFFKDAFDD